MPEALDPFKDLPIGLDNTTKILPKTVLIQDAGLGISHTHIPKPAGVWADLISQQQTAISAAAKLQLEIHQLQLQRPHQRLQRCVHRPGQPLQLKALIS